jgi:tetratricopeptide (TPR) repeat protein
VPRVAAENRGIAHRLDARAILARWLAAALITATALPAAAQAPEGAPPAEAAAPLPSSSATPSDEAQMMNTLDDEARKRFELGRTFYEAGRFREAAEEFTEAYRLSRRPALLYNIYVANRDAGRWQEATDALRGYLEQVPDAPDAITLRARLVSLEEQLALQKERDTRLEAERQRADARPAAAPSEPRRSVVPWVLMGSGGALIVGSIVTGVLAAGKASDLDDVCQRDGTLCPEAARGDVESLRALAVTTDVLWAVGAAALVTGLVLRLTRVLDERAPSPVTAGVSATKSGASGVLTVRY